MKKIILLFVAVVAFGCSSDDSNSRFSEESIYGLWRLTNLQVGSQNYTLDECELQTTWEFSETGVLFVKEKYDNNGACDTETGSIEYSLSGNIITTTNPTGGFYGGEYKAKYRIISNSDTSLTLQMIFENDEVIEGNPVFEDEPYEGDIPEQYRRTTVFVKVN